ncbi:hypothetical protein [Dysgonomonas sp. HGC4]|uniref:hypothetical protein n=1 Tax=Dysgonomonas sp. HGC4 TaxID=1658009 RepID=UPI00067FCB98|nr:hypothetical protein [Dysgonomonas sp. HGC4]MBD8349369.1 hypothetical protein [Dysgonomonas sp. HGC4]
MPRLYYYEICVNWLEVDDNTYTEFNEMDDQAQADFLINNGVEELDRKLYQSFKDSGVKITPL